MSFTSCDQQSEPLTLKSLMETVRKIKEDYPFAGMRIVESPFIPDGMMLLEGNGKIAFVKDDKVTIVKIPKIIF